MRTFCVRCRARLGIYLTGLALSGVGLLWFEIVEDDFVSYRYVASPTAHPFCLRWSRISARMSYSDNYVLHVCGKSVFSPKPRTGWWAVSPVEPAAGSILVNHGFCRGETPLGRESSVNVLCARTLRRRRGSLGCAHLACQT